jgi:plastocyanin
LVADLSYVFGNPGDKPFTGDFDGDGIDTAGLHRESSGFVYFRNSHTFGIADNDFFFGIPDDRFVAGDWNANGTDSPGLFRPSALTFFFRFTNTQGNADATFPFGQADWYPVAGRFGLVGGVPATTSSTSSTATTSPGPTSSTSSTTTLSTTTTIPSSAAVNVDDNKFVSNDVTIAAGGSVTWTWVGSNQHSTTSCTGSGCSGTPNGSWDSGEKSSGSFFHSATFSTPGTYKYFCTVHGSGMKGVVRVVSP